MQERRGRRERVQVRRGQQLTRRQMREHIE